MKKEKKKKKYCPFLRILLYLITKDSLFFSQNQGLSPKKNKKWNFLLNPMHKVGTWIYLFSQNFPTCVHLDLCYSRTFLILCPVAKDLLVQKCHPCTDSQLGSYKKGTDYGNILPTCQDIRWENIEKKFQKIQKGKRTSIYSPCTSMTVKAPSVIRAPFSNFPLTRSTISASCLLLCSKYFYMKWNKKQLYT